MGCNCTNKIKNVEKYADGPAVVEKDNEGLLENIWLFLIRIIIGILCGMVIIVGLVPLVIYITVCLMFGKTPTISLSKIRELKQKYGKKN